VAAWVTVFVRPRPDGCHDWAGERYFDGLPKAQTPDGPRLATQVLYEESGGKGRAVQRCGTRGCVNVAHLRPAEPAPTPAKAKSVPKPRVRREPAEPKPRVRASPSADACLRGHAYEGNVVAANLREGSRNCATCHAQRNVLRNLAVRRAREATGLPRDAYIARFGRSAWVALEVLRRVEAGESLDDMPATPPRDPDRLQALLA
jgi:hypothetical protein